MEHTASGTKKSLIRTRKGRTRLKFYLFASPGLIGFMILTAYPLIRSFYLSFTNRNLLYPGAEQFMGLRNYIYLLTQDPDFWSSLGNSMIYAVATVLLTNIIGIAMAVLLSKPMIGRDVFRTIFYIPSILPAIANVIMFGFIFDPNNGIVNNFLLLCGWPQNELPLWLTHSESALQTLILMACWAFGGKTIIYIAGLNGISRDIYEAAEIDGAKPVRVFFAITLPLLTPSIFYNLIMSTIGGMQVFTESFVATGGIKKFFVYYLYTVAYQRPYSLGRASAMAWLLFLVILLLTGLNWLLSKWYLKYEE